MTVFRYKMDREDVGTYTLTSDEIVANHPGITLDPSSFQAARAAVLHDHGRFPAVIWVESDDEI